MAQNPLKLGVMISGSGTNLQAIIDAIAAGELDARIVAVVSSKPGVAGIDRARRAGIDVLVMDPAHYKADVLGADKRIADFLLAAGVEYIALAGYMRMVRQPILEAFPDRVVNIHPALLPSFQGGHAIDEAWERGVKVTGVTVHFANEEYDRGPIICQRAVTVTENMDRQSLECAIHKVEHSLYPEALQIIASGRMSIGQDRKVHISAS